MSTKAFIGGAGTGKTTRLLHEMDAHLVAHPLCQGQRVLALTFMHGARHRLAERLVKSAARRRYECMTFDRFAWRICQRWRSRLRAGGHSIPSGSDDPDYDAICEAAGQLLASADVTQWVAACHPVIIIDEFQDCAPVRIALARCFHGSVELLVAADDFQNLNRTDESPAVTWLRELGVCEELTINRRTADALLIAAAQSLRAGTPLPQRTSTSFKLISAPSPDVAASFISQTMAPAAGKDTVLLSAARPGTSAWVDRVIELVSSKQYGKQRAGPLAIKWELTSNGISQVTTAVLGISDGNEVVGAAAISALPRSPVATMLNQWSEHQRRVLGRIEFSSTEVRDQVKRAAQQVRSFGSVPQSGRRAMTIHQAKNREFPVTIVLWPFRVVGDLVLQRRWLYNAITRAKRRVIVIVEDPQQRRVNEPPFAYP